MLTTKRFRIDTHKTHPNYGVAFSNNDAITIRKFFIHSSFIITVDTITIC